MFYFHYSIKNNQDVEGLSLKQQQSTNLISNIELTIESETSNNNSNNEEDTDTMYDNYRVPTSSASFDKSKKNRLQVPVLSMLVSPRDSFVKISVLCSLLTLDNTSSVKDVTSIHPHVFRQLTVYMLLILHLDFIFLYFL